MSGSIRGELAHFPAITSPILIKKSFLCPTRRIGDGIFVLFPHLGRNNIASNFRLADIFSFQRHFYRNNMIHSAVYEWLLSIVVVDNWGILSWVNLSVSHLVYNLTGTISYSKWVRFQNSL